MRPVAAGMRLVAGVGVSAAAHDDRPFGMRVPPSAIACAEAETNDAWAVTTSRGAGEGLKRIPGRMLMSGMYATPRIPAG